MLAIVARRLATGALTLLGVTWVAFAVVHLVPGDPGVTGDESLSRRLTPERIRELRALYHLDEPLHRRYGTWLGDVVRGDLGRSFHDRRAVVDKVSERLGTTLALNAASLAVMIALAVPLGAAAAWWPGSRLDRLSALMTYGLYAVPVFWAALLLQIVFAVRLGWLPLYGLGPVDAFAAGPVRGLATRVAHLVLPVACLSYGGLAYLSRFVRATLAENVRSEAVRAARARGVSLPGVIWRHAFRQAAVPMLTLAGFVLPALVSGSVIVETVFAIPGLGGLFVDAVFQRDVPVLMALILLSGGATLAGIVLADVAYGVLDPRVRRG